MAHQGPNFQDRPNNGARLICLTPTRNESWIIREFLAAAKTWADEVIVADQGSNDGTWETLQNTPGITPIANESPNYDEAHRQNLLLGRARGFEGKRILIALDADEALSANCLASAEWDKIANAAPGTVLRFRWVNILPGFEKAWIPPGRTAFGFVDDGCMHRGTKIHSCRIPSPEGAPTMDLEEIVVLHFQYVAWERMVSKRRWYQAWEHGVHRKKSPLQIFREYNHMQGGWNPEEVQPLRAEWMSNYDTGFINFRTLTSESVTWWDRELIQMMRDLGPDAFRKIAIWDKDWNQSAKSIGLDVQLNDPRSAVEKLFHRLLVATQTSRENLAVRGFEFLLRRLGW